MKVTLPSGATVCAGAPSSTTIWLLVPAEAAPTCEVSETGTLNTAPAVAEPVGAAEIATGKSLAHQA
ncbi:hypothetical protein D3C85_1937570 [compost metagenome]